MVGTVAETAPSVEPGDTTAGGLLGVRSKIGFEGPNTSFLTITYDFTGMMLTAGSNPVLTISTEVEDNGARIGARDQGQAGDTSVTFVVARGSDSFAANIVVLELDEVALMTDGDGGSVKISITDDAPVPKMHMNSWSNAVRTMSVINAMPTPVRPIATVETSYLSFKLRTPAADGSAIDVNQHI